MTSTRVPRSEERPQIVLRPIATPLPLGFVALAVGTLVLAPLQLGWLQDNETDQVAFVLLGFTAPLQATACIVGFRARDAVAATGMGVLAGTWTVVGVTLLTSTPGSTSDALGVMLLGTAAALAIPALSASRKPVAAAVLGTATLRFALTGAAQLTASQFWMQVAGWVGLALALLAWYAAAAFQFEAVQHRTVLPLLRRQNAEHSNDSRPQTPDLSQQVVDEPGVRSQL
jgi:succinate-acetate transporter protein